MLPQIQRASAKLNAPTRTGDRCHKRSSRTFRHRQFEPELIQHPSNVCGIGMLRAQGDQRGTRRGARSRMWRRSPVNEKWNDPIGDHGTLIRGMPQKKDTRRRSSAPRYDIAQRHSSTMRIVDLLRQVAALRCPRHKTRAAQRVYPEPSGTIGVWLFRIGREDFQVGRRTERDEGIARALPWVLSTRGGANPQQCLDALDTGREVGRRVHEMIDLPEEQRCVAGLRVQIEAGGQRAYRDRPDDPPVLHGNARTSGARQAGRSAGRRSTAAVRSWRWASARSSSCLRRTAYC